MKQKIEFDEALLKKYNISGPRYTSYPTAVQFSDTFELAGYHQALSQSNTNQPLSLYFHIPFCDTVCFYCGCNKIATKDHTKSPPYLSALYQEIAMHASLTPTTRVVEQLHFGGGTPTFLNDAEMTDLMANIREHFTLADDEVGEFSIEIDPRKANGDTIRHLRSLGFNRLSVGVQDFYPDVQKAVNRIQSREETMAVIDAARDCGFKSVSIDLIYGLPHQTLETFSNTLDEVISISPDRLSVFNYAHMPHLFKPQRRINESDLPSTAEKLKILQRSIEQLSDAGYAHIGIDHFAKPDDELAIAQREGHLHRNFQGYSTHAECDLIAMGVSGIGQVGDCFAQNVRTLDEYYAAIERKELPIFRGFMMTEDDHIRRHVIMELMCHYTLDFGVVEQTFGLKFAEYFKSELEALKPFEEDGLLVQEGPKVIVQPKGRLLIRNIAMVFDYYLNQGKSVNKFSKVI
ncbi:MAG: oxygen-independent coproporphyrinogen III oxidase [Methylococcales bacterium]|nr:oxygen-independent coproporphyrinogen III oxidase [Methylococcales bacterium]MBT7443542.1 oxygen-independent coproporphyrinogen III oxidase [Methylococcales bacterium]